MRQDSVYPWRILTCCLASYKLLGDWLGAGDTFLFPCSVWEQHKISNLAHSLKSREKILATIKGDCRHKSCSFYFYNPGGTYEEITHNCIFCHHFLRVGGLCQ